MDALSSRRAPRLIAAVLCSAASALAWLAPARASCHVATWESEHVRVRENAGPAELVMELDGFGPVECTGSIKWETSDQSARSPADYSGGSGRVSWKTGGPRRQTVRIPIVDDKLDEGGETFTVTMTESTGGISPEQPGQFEGGPTLQVFIADDERTSVATTPPASTTPPAPTTPPAITSQPVAQATATGSSGNAGLVAGIVAGVVILGGLAALMMRRRRAQ